MLTDLARQLQQGRLLLLSLAHRSLTTTTRNHLNQCRKRCKRKLKKAAAHSATTPSAPPRPNSARCLIELDLLLRGYHKVAVVCPSTGSGVVFPMYLKSSKQTELKVPKSQVADAQLPVEVLTWTAAEKKRAAKNSKSCCFDAHDHALESSIATKIRVLGNLLLLTNSMGN